MPYEQLIESVETSADEKISELREKAGQEAAQILKEAEDKDELIRKKHMDLAKKTVQIERNRFLATIKGDARLQATKVKDEVFKNAMAKARLDLQSVRTHPGYEKTFRELFKEAVQELAGERIEIHIDKRDEALCRDLATELAPDCDIVTDITSAGGVNVSTKDGRFMIFNTVESRFERAKVLLKPEIFSALYGGQGGL